MQILKGLGKDTYTIISPKITITINGVEISGYAFDDWYDIWAHHKFKPRSSRQELFVKDTPEGRKIFTDISTIMEKDVDIVPSKDGWLRVRPAFNEKEMNLIKNYLKMTEV